MGLNPASLVWLARAGQGWVTYLGQISWRGGVSYVAEE